MHIHLNFRKNFFCSRLEATECLSVEWVKWHSKSQKWLKNSKMENQNRNWLICLKLILVLINWSYQVWLLMMLFDISLKIAPKVWTSLEKKMHFKKSWAIFSNLVVACNKNAKFPVQSLLCNGYKTFFKDLFQQSLSSIKTTLCCKLKISI